MHSRAIELLHTLGMHPHPEGGHYAEVFRSAHRVRVIGRNVDRAALTTIYFSDFALAVDWPEVAARIASTEPNFAKFIG